MSDQPTLPEPPTVEHALDRLRATAFITEEEHPTDRCSACNRRAIKRRTIQHALAGGLGADWDLDAAITYVEEADTLKWVSTWITREPALQATNSEGRTVLFDWCTPG